MEEKTLYIIPVGEKKTPEEALVLVKKFKAMCSEEIQVADEDFQCYVIKK